MTNEQFDKYEFRNSTIAVYQGKEYPIQSVDFGERLIEIKTSGYDCNNTTWIRSDNCELKEWELKIKPSTIKPKLL